jgi:hypothetical protein
MKKSGGGYPLNKFNKSSWLSISVLFLLTSCGADVAAVYRRSLYHTNEFSENHYVDRVIADQFQPEQIAFTTNWTFPPSAISDAIPITENDPNGDQFALTQKLSRSMPSIAYGFESKIFDGILFCTDAQRLSKSRLQLLPSGFGYVFPRQLATYKTLGLFMKSGADTDAGAQKIIDVNILLSLYRASNFGWEQFTLTLNIRNLIGSNFPGYYEISLPENVLQGISAMSFTYEIVNPLPATDLENLTGIFLYEVLFPYSTWVRPS